MLKRKGEGEEDGGMEEADGGDVYDVEKIVGKKIIKV
jgi:hypothetical protein